MVVQVRQIKTRLSVLILMTDYSLCFYTRINVKGANKFKLFTKFVSFESII